jgi:hypothetical protein
MAGQEALATSEGDVVRLQRCVFSWAWTFVLQPINGESKLSFDLIESDACYYLFVMKHSTGYIEKIIKGHGLDVFILFKRKAFSFLTTNIRLGE